MRTQKTVREGSAKYKREESLALRMRLLDAR